MDNGDLDTGPTCPDCGAELIPTPIVSELGMRLAYECPAHGLTTIVSPFDEF